MELIGGFQTSVFTSDNSVEMLPETYSFKGTNMRSMRFKRIMMEKIHKF